MCWVHVCEYTLDGWNGMKWAGIRLLLAKWEPTNVKLKRAWWAIFPSSNELVLEVVIHPPKGGVWTSKTTYTSSIQQFSSWLWLSLPSKRTCHVQPANYAVFFNPTVEIVPKKRIGTTVSRGFGTTIAGWWSKNRKKKMRTGGIPMTSETTISIHVMVILVILPLVRVCYGK